MSNYLQIFDETLKKNINSLVMKAHNDVLKIRETTTFLHSDIGIDLLGHMERICVDFYLYNACQNNKLPFVASFEKNKAENCNHVVMRNSGVTVLTSRVFGLKELPRNAHFRQEILDNAQGDLFIDSNNQDEKSFQELCIYLTHCPNRNFSLKKIDEKEKYPVSFVSLGIPFQDNSNKKHYNWAEYENIFIDKYIVEQETQIEKEVNPEIMLNKMKEEINILLKKVK